MSQSRILIVEDEGIVAKDISTILNYLGYDVVGIVSTGKKAIQQATDSRPDAVLMDIKLKGEMDGIEAAASIHSELDIPVIYLTAFTDERTLERAKTTDPYGYLTKPVDKNELRVALEIALHKYKTERVLKESEERYRSLQNNVPVGVFRSNPENDGSLVTVNPSLIDMFGYGSQDEMFDRSVSELYRNPADRNKFVDAITQLGSISDFETEFVRKDGSAFWGALSATATKNADGKLDSIDGVIENITKRKFVEEALKESEKKYRTLVEGLHEGLAIVDIDENIIFANEALCEIFGVPLSKIIGLNLKDIVHEESIGRLNSENEKRKTRISSQYELRIVREDGEHRDINVSARPLINKDDQYEGTVGLVLDITETKKARLELKKSYETLENTLQSTVLAISKIVESRDPYTSGHQTRTAKLARSIAEEMGFTEDEIKPIYMASVLHDIGKISAPQEILSKPGKLTDLEFEIIKTHPSVGYDILVNIDFPWPISDIVVQHHEKIDGSGYPAGLKNGEILLEARIICVADVVEAMSSHRPYRPALGIDKALEEIREKKGILYDEDVVDACSKIVSHKGFSFE